MDDFVPAQKFAGAKSGYIFKKDSKGVGYYRDHYLPSKESEPNIHPSKQTAPIRDSNPASLKNRKVEFENIDFNSVSKIEKLDSKRLLKICKSFKENYENNQKMRIKYPNDPLKFMDSEVELDTSVQEIQAITTDPDLFEEFVKFGGFETLLLLLGHENPDIVTDALGILFDLLDPENFEESETADVLPEKFLGMGGLELVYSALPRMNDKDADEERGIYNILGIFENMCELYPLKTPQILGEKTKILEFLINAIKDAKELSENNLYMTEILAILIQSSNANQIAVGKLGGVEHLTVKIGDYRLKNPEDSQEEEMVQNIFDSLSALAREPSNQQAFIDSEVIELLIIMIKSHKFCHDPALKLLDYVLNNNPICCNKFVEELGLKTLFSELMQKGKNRKKFDERANEEHAVACIYHLLRHCTSNNFERLLFKFVENNFEKAERFTELHKQFYQRVHKFDKELQQRLSKVADDEITEEDQDEIYLQRLDAGLFTLQYTDFVIAKVSHDVPQVKEKFVELFQQHNLSLQEVAAILEDLSNNLGNLNEKLAEKEKELLLDLGMQFFV